MLPLRIRDIIEIACGGSEPFGWRPRRGFTHVLGSLVSFLCALPALGMLPTGPSRSCGVVASAVPCSLALLGMVGWSWLLLLGMRAGIHSVLMVLLVPVHEGSPLGELHRCIREGVKVNVHIRTFKGLRGVCTGFLVAFDKFWNMVIKPSARNWSTS